MHSSRLRRSARRVVTGTAGAAATILVACLMAAPAGVASEIPAAPPPAGSTGSTGSTGSSGSTIGQVGGSALGLGRNLTGHSSGTGTGPTVMSGPGTGPARYVALGDSYSAVGRIAPGAWAAGPAACMRTTDAYPTVVARALGVGTFVNATCGGAVANDFRNVGMTGAPPQFDALDDQTDLVTVTIGGNDVGFPEMVVACTLRPNTSPGYLPLLDAAVGSLGDTNGCADVIDGLSATRLDDLDRSMDSVYAEIAERSPGALVVAVGYLTPVPDDQTIRSSPVCAPLMAITEDEREKVRLFLAGLNRVVSDAAERNGVTVVIPDESGHSLCTPAETRWVDLTGSQTGAAPMHPTTAGHAHVAARILAAIAEQR